MEQSRPVRPGLEARRPPHGSGIAMMLAASAAGYLLVGMMFVLA